MTYIDLLEYAALYHVRYAQLLRNSIETTGSPSTKNRTPPKRKTTGSPSTKNRTQAEDAVEYPDWHRTCRAAYGIGFLIVRPFALWEKMDLPGLNRIKHALALAMLASVYSGSPAGRSSFTQHTISAADGNATLFAALSINVFEPTSKQPRSSEKMGSAFVLLKKTRRRTDDKDHGAFDGREDTVAGLEERHAKIR